MDAFSSYTLPLLQQKQLQNLRHTLYAINKNNNDYEKTAAATAPRKSKAPKQQCSVNPSAELLEIMIICYTK